MALLKRNTPTKHSVICKWSNYATARRYYALLMCSAESSVNCDFEQPFKCGYASTELGSLSWSRTNSANLFKKSTGPLAGSQGSTTGRLISTVSIVHQLWAGASLRPARAGWIGSGQVPPHQNIDEFGLAFASSPHWRTLAYRPISR